MHNQNNTKDHAMNESQKKQAYIKSIPAKTGNYQDYEAAKRWYNKNIKDSSQVSYTRFVVNVANRVGV